jgi:tripartite-type tricarboxylate transporter receptor subunit TctC
MKIVLALAALTFAGSVLAAEPLEIPGANSAYYMLKSHTDRIRAASDVDLTVAPVGTGRAMLDLIEGRAKVAVVTVPFMDAVASARVLAWSEEHRLLVVPRQIAYYDVPTPDSNGRPLAFVTMGDPSPELSRVIRYLSDRGNNRTALNQ